MVDRSRKLLPVVAIVVVTVAVQKLVFESRYEVEGHVAGHLGSAAAPFAAFALVATLLLLIPAIVRQPEVLAAGALWEALAVVVAVANVRVVDAGVQGAPGWNSAHELADRAMWWAVGGAILFTLALWRRGHISGGLALAAVVLSVVFPPWIFPGFGIVVIAVVRVVRVLRTDTTSEGVVPAPAA